MCCDFDSVLDKVFKVKAVEAYNLQYRKFIVHGISCIISK